MGMAGLHREAAEILPRCIGYIIGTDIKIYNRVSRFNHGNNEIKIASHHVSGIGLIAS